MERLIIFLAIIGICVFGQEELTPIENKTEDTWKLHVGKSIEEDHLSKQELAVINAVRKNFGVDDEKAKHIIPARSLESNIQFKDFLVDNIKRINVCFEKSEYTSELCLTLNVYSTKHRSSKVLKKSGRELHTFTILATTPDTEYIACIDVEILDDRSVIAFDGSVISKSKGQGWALIGLSDKACILLETKWETK